MSARPSRIVRSGRAPGPAQQSPPATDVTGPHPEVPPQGAITGIGFLDAAFDKAVQIPSAAIHAHVDRLRLRNPNATPAQIITMLEKQYLLAVSTSGGAVGAAAATPAVGTGVAMALTTSEVATFFAASSAFSLAVADVHGIGVDEAARRRALLLATVLGDQGAKTIGAETGLGSKAWARSLLVNMPTSTIRRVNSALTRRLLRRQVAKQGGLAIGRLAPFGIGAVVGATGARALGRTVITSAQRAFGPPPDRFPRTIELVAQGTEPGQPRVLRVPRLLSRRPETAEPAPGIGEVPPVTGDGPSGAGRPPGTGPDGPDAQWPAPR